MKITCTQENLKTGLQSVSRIIGNSNTLPILNNLLLKTENGLLKIVSTNLEISIYTTIRCKVEEVGEACVPAKTLTDLVSTLPSKNVCLEVVGSSLKVTSEKYNAQIKILPSEDFPSVPLVESQTSFVARAGELKFALQEVLFAASVNETQPEISGVLFKGTDAGCMFVATDRYRLAEKKVVSNKLAFAGMFILPLKTVHELNKTLNNPDAEVVVSVGENQVQFAVEDTQIISRVIDGQYPEYEHIIPKEFGITVEVKKNDFQNALKASNVFSSGTNSIKLLVSENSQELVVSSGNQELGESTIEVPAKVVGGDVAILFNYRYVMDMLSNVDAIDIVVKINNDALPVVFNKLGVTDYLYLVMPIKN